VFAPPSSTPAMISIPQTITIPWADLNEPFIPFVSHPQRNSVGLNQPSPPKGDYRQEGNQDNSESTENYLGPLLIGAGVFLLVYSLVND